MGRGTGRRLLGGPIGPRDGPHGIQGCVAHHVARLAGSKVTGIALPPLPGGAFERAGVAGLVDSHIVDIRDGLGVSDVMRRATEPDVVFHLAAQALVPSSYADPVGTFDVNVTGTARCSRPPAAASRCDRSWW